MEFSAVGLVPPAKASQAVPDGSTEKPQNEGQQGGAEQSQGGQQAHKRPDGQAQRGHEENRKKWILQF
jgi:hypothetical protein